MVYVVSDIHGNERRFNSIMEKINLQEEDTLYVLGDVIDRHPGGIRILRRIMKMPNAKMLLGNHEYMMLRALGYPYDTNEILSAQDMQSATMLWYQNGGKVTHQYWKRIRRELRAEIIDYLRNLPANIDIEVDGQPYKLVHGAPIEDYWLSSEYETAAQYSVWKRLCHQDMNDREYTLILGHTPTEYYQDCIPMKIWRHGNGMAIDCGCGYPESCYGQRGRLACLRLNDGIEYYSDEAV